MIKSILQDNISGLNKTFGFTEEISQLSSKMLNTCKNGESSSFMIIGKSGSGKTKLVNAALASLEIQCDKEMDNMFVVKLDGKVQQDDRVALQSIGRQLKVCIEMEEDEEAMVTNDSFSKSFQLMIEMLQSGGASIIFVVENVDVYLHQKSQMLAYNLLNAVQLHGVPVCIVLTTCRLDISEMMEKRVKSRFSHHHIILSPYTATLQNYKAVVAQYLKIDLEHRRLNSFITDWNTSVDEFLARGEVLNILEQAYFVSDTMADLKKLLIPVIANLSSSIPKLTLEDLRVSCNAINYDSKYEIIKNLSDHQLTVLIVIHKFVTVHDDDMNFEKVYREYQQFCMDYHRVCCPKPDILKCVDYLMRLQLISLQKVHSSSSSSLLPFNYRNLCLNVSQDSIEQIFQSSYIDSALCNYFSSKVAI